ncbi:MULTISPECIES: nitroreductase family protein [unclassified Rathayibacter]|uniref:nitroreductase family protein n=1 Tax=unclassified Rathayibacter TaxID=2609250 RepID=UPI000F9A7098|nr:MULTISPECIES: nitroreductase family protein [unclassified Rathayibacter]ROP57734.1 nitroreductase [Rathayibacter sp. PhB186]ROS56119.1 nitroreductase [Rathayibacter sp. PhB185]
MSSLRSTAGRVKRGLTVRLRQGTPLERALYYTFISDAFSRERKLVAKGHQEYSKRVEGGRQEFLLRRNIHMLEKGLTMRPRRETYGIAYVEETVRLFRQILAAPTPIISVNVEHWAREVLDRYFDATATSAAPEIQRARASYESFLWEAEGNKLSGPHAPFVDQAPVDIDSITALAVRRKSVRWFKPDKVEREKVDRAMLVAAEAPSACNRQPFSFRIFDDPEMVAAVTKIPMGTAGYGHNLPSVAVIVGNQSAFIDERDRHLIYIDGCLAAMSFILGLESQGVASVCINWPDIAARDKKMSDLLHLESYERVVMLVGYGYADETGDTPFSAKRALKDLRSYNQL